MFESLRRQWREARAAQLGAEWDDLVMRIGGGSEKFRLRLVDRLDALSAWIDAEYGSLDNVSDATKRALVTQLRRLANDRFHRDLGGSYAAAVLGCYIESCVLRGPDADRVRASAIIAIDAAKEQCRYLEALPD